MLCVDVLDGMRLASSKAGGLVSKGSRLDKTGRI